MNAEEKRLIEDLFGRLRNFDGESAKDPAAEALIRDLVGRSPDAPYYLAQTVIIQQQALERAEARMRDLEAASRQPQYTGRGGSFLPGASVPSTGGNRYATEPQEAPEPAAAPPQSRVNSSAWAPAQAGSGGFLSSALTTAAGVAGGVFLADGIRSLFGGGSRAYASGNDIANAGDQATADRLQDEAQDARDDADQAQKDLAADDAELDNMQDAQDDAEDNWSDDDDLDV
jgi:hypothetical protein